MTLGCPPPSETLGRAFGAEVETSTGVRHRPDLYTFAFSMAQPRLLHALLCGPTLQIKAVLSAPLDLAPQLIAPTHEERGGRLSRDDLLHGCGVTCATVASSRPQRF